MAEYISQWIKDQYVVIGGIAAERGSPGSTITITYPVVVFGFIHTAEGNANTARLKFCYVHNLGVGWSPQVSHFHTAIPCR
jgi:hypothetical protein